ncbi:fatty acid desaturase [Flavobacterium sp. HSC-32F16]|uniref:fatty acid desaturase family protein n=1 Tax=Flavobacterium sp. HSC-32F16 TaxID=2910964 RepID=UPI0020A5B00A|nr:fatty acid desaturase [Flavobacterium sp. HSC-32F16]MCP2029669.1 fatty acid desaturase [Flavobacterium sp. HSC-32F16]
MKYKIQALTEISIEKKLRKNFLLIPLATLILASLLSLSIAYCMNLYEKGYYWAFIPAGFFVHSFLIITVHDGSHKAITKTKLDRFILNLCSALVFLPFYGEHYRKYHLIHHGYTNTDFDPLSSSKSKYIYQKNRFLYILLESIPLLYTFYLIFDFNNKESTKKVNSALKINRMYFLITICISIIWFWLLQPPVYFVLFTLIFLNIISAVRSWCEHMGTSLEHKTNTYWFPMGFGIGNHDVHHEYPNLSWLTLAIGLTKREKNSNPVKSIKGILLDKKFTFYNVK